MYHGTTTAWLHLILVQLMFNVQSTEAQKYLENVPCDVYSEIVAVDSPSHQYRPYFIKLQQCQGADTNPKGHKCVPTKKEDISITVILEEPPFGYDVKTVANHTACNFVCELDNSMCNIHQKWNEDICMCDCTKDDFDCGDSNKYWSTTTCECMESGRQTNPQCSGALQTKYVVIIALLELVLVSVLWIIIIRFCYYNKDNRNDRDGDEEEAIALSKKEVNGEVVA